MSRLRSVFFPEWTRKCGWSEQESKSSRVQGSETSRIESTGTRLQRLAVRSARVRGHRLEESLEP